MRQRAHPDQYHMDLPLSVEPTWRAPTGFPELSGTQVWDLECWDPNLMERGPGWRPGGEGYVAGFSVTTADYTGYYPIRHPGGLNFPVDQTKNWVRAQLKRPGPKIFASAQYDVGWLAREGLEVNPLEIHDVLLQAPLLDEFRRSYSLNSLGLDYEQEKKDERLLHEALARAGFGTSHAGIAKVPANCVGDYAEQDSRLTFKLWRRFNDMLVAEELGPVYELERSLVAVLIAMRMRGVPVNVRRAEEQYRTWSLERDAALAQVKHLTGIKVDPWNATACSMALAHRGIKCDRTSQGQPSVTADWLDAQDDDVARLISRARKLDKAAETFVKGFVLEHQHAGRVHCQFNQLRSDEGGTITGRFSSSVFNLQQIPIRDPEIGPLVRALFEAEHSKEDRELWLSGDYSSQEPRLTIHFAALTGLHGTRAVVERYRENPLTDWHQLGADFCGIARDQSKPINLGIAYGMGGPKLCRSLGLPTAYKEIFDKRLQQTITIEVAGPEGQAILDKYDAGLPFVRKLAKNCQRRGEQRGYVKTLLGRRSRFKKTYDGRWDDTRKAMNKLIQGSAADQTKEAMRQLYYDHGVTPLATVHDELACSVPDEKRARELTHVMEHAVELEVPTVVDCKLGQSWGTTKKLAWRDLGAER